MPLAMTFNRKMLFWGLASREIEEVIEFYASEAEAVAGLADVLHDEPAWEGIIFVVSVDFAGPTSWN